MQLIAAALASLALIRPPTLPIRRDQAPAALLNLLSPLLQSEEALSAPPVAENPPLSPAASIKGLYKAFNDRDADAAASFLADDCVYEDLLLVRTAQPCRVSQLLSTELACLLATAATAATTEIECFRCCHRGGARCFCRCRCIWRRATACLPLIATFPIALPACPSSSFTFHPLLQPFLLS